LRKNDRINDMEQKIKILSRGIRKYIRREKARIRREIFDLARQKELIRELYAKVGIENYPAK
jgi:hypothetical protein